MALIRSYYALCPLGLESILENELREAGAQSTKTSRSGVRFRADEITAMRACVTSRIASRILLSLGDTDYYDEEDIYNFACRTKWEHYFDPDATFRIDVTAHRSPLNSLDFTLLRIKDGICDRFNHFMQTRPSIDRVHPDVRIFAHVDSDRCTFYLDLCGESLFKRGWRRDKGEAPLKENLAAGLLALSGWTPEMPLADIFCGSGTIAIEAGQIATHTAPGLNRHFLFEKFKGFDRDMLEEVKDDARAQVNPYVDVSIQASDISSIVVSKARDNAARAGLSALLESGKLTFEVADARVASPKNPEGLVVSNPPYGEQSNPKSASVASMMKDVSDNLKRHWAGHTAWLLTSDRQLPRQMRLSEARKIPLFNGPLECRFFRFDLVSGSFRKDTPQLRSGNLSGDVSDAV